MKYEISYWETLISAYEIEADSREEAEAKFQEMIDCGEIEGDIIDERGFEITYEYED